MTKLDRVRALIALATNETTPEEESRTAALLAVRMIQEYGIVLSEETGTTPPPSVVFEEFIRPARPRVDLRYHATTIEGVDVSGQQVGWHVIKAKFRGRCYRCGDPIEVGQKIWWRMGVAPNCEPCGPVQARARRGA